MGPRQQLCTCGPQLVEALNPAACACRSVALLTILKGSGALIWAAADVVQVWCCDRILCSALTAASCLHVLCSHAAAATAVCSSTNLCLAGEACRAARHAGPGRPADDAGLHVCRCAPVPLLPASHMCTARSLLTCAMWTLQVGVGCLVGPILGNMVVPPRCAAISVLACAQGYQGCLLSL